MPLAVFFGPKGTHKGCPYVGTWNEVSQLER